MARNLHVYPKVVLDGSTWTLRLDVSENGVQEAELTFSLPADVTTAVPLVLLKIVFDAVVGDSDTAQDVLDALTVDDIKPGPQIATVATNWIERAENDINGLSPGFTAEDFKAAQSKQDTSKMRSDAKGALEDRGWTIVPGSIHQHEGDGTNTDE
jgi:hypothetical protein